MSNIPFVCKSCGGKTFKVASKPATLDDLDGAVCGDCGATFGKRDVEDQVRKIAGDLVRDSLRKAGFK